MLHKERELEMWAEGASTAYHLHVPKLYSRIIPDLCRKRSSSKHLKLHITLQKERNIPWKFLKG